MVDPSGVYERVCQFFDRDAQQWSATSPYPCQRILEGLEARQAVNVPACAVPGDVLEAAPSRPGPLRIYGKHAGTAQRVYPSRAIVGPDDRITFNDDDWARYWLEGNPL